MGNTSPGCYFLKAMNMAFHDLTEGKLLPPTATSLLGLSLKFIPTPRYAPSVTDVAPPLDQIEWDIKLKTFFTGRDQGGKIPDLCAKSSWRLPLPPRPINYQVNSFLQGLKKLFHWRAGKCNLTPHQRQLLSSLQENESIVIVNADKNLGPVGIDVKHYIKLGLDHLLDPSTYELLTKEQADHNIQDLRSAIHAWMVRHHRLLPDDTVNLIRKHMDKASKDPLG
jgi:hypothetical protein